MNRLKTLATLAILAISFNAFSQTAEAIQKMFVSYLETEGYDEVFIDADGDVQFEVDGYNYYVEVNEGDPEFARVVLFGFWSIDSMAEHMKALQACHDITKDYKVIKAYITDGDNVYIASEMFVSRPEDFRKHLPRSLSIISDAKDDFIEAM